MKQHFSSVWTREQRTAKSPLLSRAQIVRAAMELLDAEGLDALSMRRLGTKLGSGTTSVYWHVANKNELLELVLDEVYGEFTVLDVQETTWRNAASSFAYGIRQALFKHPWVMSFIGTTPAIGPNAMRMMSRLVATFDHAGFRGLDQDHAASTLMAYVLGVTAPELSWRALREEAGLDSNELNAAIQPSLEKAAADYPDLVARYKEYRCMDVDTARALNFEFGLTCFLDGLEARLNRAASPRTSRVRSPAEDDGAASR
ncbi:MULTISPECIES: TetR/AcrR family transcriptional regulator [unclassified Streptosporangium]|uniref:TetR/AcrR family transcriptional regulator n=1 Tax=unclassified Streptosporangium TaxID=2632669 RepID=UPI002E28C264|nr:MULTISPECIES: TetR/AcrR family transcriptional regulator C-terminal domain-containing protein [unclassified Streptosporangium]